MEGSNSFRAPTKGDQVRLKPENSTIHAVVMATSNMPDKAEFLRIAKEMNGKSTWTSADFDRNISESGSRIGATMRSEEQIPAILRKELVPCCRCGAEYIKWAIKRLMTARNGKIVIPKEQIWQHSDDEDETSPVRDDIDEWSDFFEVMKMAHDELEKQQELNESIQNQNTLQTIKVLSKEYEEFQRWRANKESEDTKKVGLQSPSKVGIASGEKSSIKKSQSPSNLSDSKAMSE